MWDETKSIAREKAKKCGKAEKVQLDKIMERLEDEGVCRVKIKDKCGEDFLEWQYKGEEVFETLLKRIKGALKNSTQEGNLKEINDRVDEWLEGKKNFELYYEKGDWRGDIYMHEIKKAVTTLLTQTKEDIKAYTTEHKTLEGEDGKYKEYKEELEAICSRLDVINSQLAETDVPDTEKTYKRFMEFKEQLNKIREDVLSPLSVAEAEDKLDYLAEMVDKVRVDSEKGDLKGKEYTDIKELSPYLTVRDIKPGQQMKYNPDGLTAATYCLKVLNKNKTFVDKGYDESINTVLNQPTEDTKNIDKLEKSIREETEKFKAKTPREQQLSFNAFKIKIGELQSQLKWFNERQAARITGLVLWAKKNSQNIKAIITLMQEINDYLLRPGATYKSVFETIMDENAKIYDFPGLYKRFQDAITNNDSDTITDITATLVATKKYVTDHLGVVTIGTDTDGNIKTNENEGGGKITETVSPIAEKDTLHTDNLPTQDEINDFMKSLDQYKEPKTEKETAEPLKEGETEKEAAEAVKEGETQTKDADMGPIGDYLSKLQNKQ